MTTTADHVLADMLENLDRLARLAERARTAADACKGTTAEWASLCDAARLANADVENAKRAVCSYCKR